MKSYPIFKKGQVIFHVGTAPIGFYIIQIGKVKKYSIILYGREHIFYLAKEEKIINIIEHSIRITNMEKLVKTCNLI